MSGDSPPPPDGTNRTVDETNGEDAPEDNGGRMKICVRDNGNEHGLEMRVKPTTKISKILLAWADQFQHNLAAWRFFIDGVRIRGNDPERKTVADWELEDEDTIEALREQHGGSTVT